MFGQGIALRCTWMECLDVGRQGDLGSSFSFDRLE